MTVVEGSILKVMTWQQVWSFGVVLWELYSRGAQPYMEFTSSQEIVTRDTDSHHLTTAQKKSQT
jgi:hypothetical protein